MTRWTPIATVALMLVAPADLMAASCAWREPARTYAADQQWDCVAYRWADGDTLTAACQGSPEPVRIRLRGVDTVERGEPGWSAARMELQRLTRGMPLVVRPHHGSFNRVVAEVTAGGQDIGLAMDAAGWSKPDCPRR